MESVYKIGNIGDLIKDNSYVGRGVVIGESENGKNAVFAYFIMGRSENSRNRIFKDRGEEVTIYPFDESKVEDPSLIIYSPVRRAGNSVIVTNGDQTDTVYDFLMKGKTFEEALETRCFEPDAPNFTPRISGVLDFKDKGFTYKLSILKSADEKGSACNRYTFSYSPLAGVGEPERVKISDDIEEFFSDLWNNLNEQNKISLYVRYTDLASGKTQAKMINKNR